MLYKVNHACYVVVLDMALNKIIHFGGLCPCEKIIRLTKVEIYDILQTIYDEPEHEKFVTSDTSENLSAVQSNHEHVVGTRTR
ncbi:hypothetical protein NPIL_296641 [Nephila pilipes]|uniref:Uncharacterized protein n=1 Tax=Nephila pilipes TaxID=299642 RepID=A0A8X6QGL2_NEPPI|nr:hypothetical protein NPIL_296641 [Nephila pilipes]